MLFNASRLGLGALPEFGCFKKEIWLRLSERFGSRVSMSVPRRKHSEDLLQPVAESPEVRSGVGGKGKRRLVLFHLDVRPQLLPGSGNGEAFIIEKLLDAKGGFNILAAVHPLPGAAFDWFELREFSLPETEHVSRQTAKLGDLSDSELQFFRNDDFWRG